MAFGSVLRILEVLELIGNGLRLTGLVQSMWLSDNWVATSTPCRRRVAQTRQSSAVRSPPRRLLSPGKFGIENEGTELSLGQVAGASPGRRGRIESSGPVAGRVRPGILAQSRTLRPSPETMKPADCPQRRSFSTTLDPCQTPAVWMKLSVAANMIGSILTPLTFFMSTVRFGF